MKSKLTIQTNKQIKIIVLTTLFNQFIRKRGIPIEFR